MSPFVILTQNVFAWTETTSTRVSLLIVVVVILQAVLGRRLTAGLRYALSVLVLGGLLMPVSPRTGLSLENLVRMSANFSNSNPPQLASMPPPVQMLAAQIEPSPWRPSLSQSVALVWLTGCLALVVIAVWRHQRWRRLIAAGQPVTDRVLLDMLGSAKESMGVHRPISVNVVEKLNTPAVFGLLQTHLLLPEVVLRHLSPRELRMVILHELAHVRRNDLLLNWVLTAVQFLHWFNPLVWLAMHRFRADRELVCDAMVLQRLHSAERPEYGRVLLKLLEGLRNESLACSGAIPVISSRREMKERILLIKHHRKASVAGSLGMALLVAVLCCSTLTTAKEPKSFGTNSALIVAIDQNGNYRLLHSDGRLLTTNRLEEELRLARKRSRELKLNIRADRNAPFAQIIKVMDLAREVRITNISATSLEGERKPSQRGDSSASLDAPTNVVRIDIKRVGPTWASDEVIRSNVSLRVGHEADPRVIDEDVRKLYATGHFYSIKVATEHAPAGFIVSYILQDGPRVKAIRFVGNKRFDDAALLRAVSTKVDETFDDRKVFRDTQLIQKHYEEAGFKKVQVKNLLDLDEKNGRCIITFKVEENLEGADRTSRPRSIRDTPLRIMKPDLSSGFVTTSWDPKAGEHVHRALSVADAAHLAARLANETCEHQYHRSPFNPEQHSAVLQDGLYNWGNLDVGGASGFSAVVTFRPDGSDPHVEVYFSSDALLRR